MNYTALKTVITILDSQINLMKMVKELLDGDNRSFVQRDRAKTQVDICGRVDWEEVRLGQVAQGHRLSEQFSKLALSLS